MTTRKMAKHLLVGMVCVACLVACGSAAWMRIFPSSAALGAGYAVAVDSQQNAYVYGEYYPNLGEVDIKDAEAHAFLAKYSPSGERLWETRWIDTSSYDLKILSLWWGPAVLDYLRVDANDNVYLISFISDSYAASSNVRISRIAASGEQQWQYDFPFESDSDFIKSLQSYFDAEGNLYLRNISNNHMLSVDPEGNLRWSRTLTDGLDGDGSVAAGAARDVIWNTTELLLLDPVGHSVQRISAQALGVEEILDVVLMDTLVVFGSTSNTAAAARLLQPSPEGYVLDQAQSLEFPHTQNVSVARHPAGGFCLTTYNRSEPELFTYYLDDQLNQIWRAPEPAIRLEQLGLFMDLFIRDTTVRADEQGCYLQYLSDSNTTKIVRYNTQDGAITFTLAPLLFVGNSMEIHGNHLWQTGALTIRNADDDLISAKAVTYRHVVR